MVALVNASHPTLGTEDNKKTHVVVKENVLYEGLTQFARTHKYYKVTATRQFYTGSEHMTFKVIADDFGSDPDIYIARSD